MVEKTNRPIASFCEYRHEEWDLARMVVFFFLIIQTNPIPNIHGFNTYVICYSVFEIAYRMDLLMIKRFNFSSGVLYYPQIDILSCIFKSVSNYTDIK